MFSEVCTPLITRCLHAPLLYIGGPCSLTRSHQPYCGVAATVYRREQGPRRFGRKLNSEDGGEHLGEACRKARRRPTYAWGRPEAIHGVTQPEAWPLRGIPCEGLQRGLGRSMRAFRYLGKNIGVVDGSLHMSTLLFSFHIYIVCITIFAVEITTH